MSQPEKLDEIQEKLEQIQKRLKWNNEIVDRIEKRLLYVEQTINYKKDLQRDIDVKLEKIEAWLIALENILKINSINLKDEPNLFFYLMNLGEWRIIN